MSRLTLCLVLAMVFTNAQAQMPTWSTEQSAVWAYVEQSWVDDAAENGRWPGEYTHENAISWDSNNPAPEARDAWIESTRFGDQQDTIVRYSLTPLAIAIVDDTAVVNYFAVVNTEDLQGEREREVVRIVETLIREDGAWLYLSSTGIPMDLDDD